MNVWRKNMLGERDSRGKQGGTMEANWIFVQVVRPQTDRIRRNRQTIDHRIPHSPMPNPTTVVKNASKIFDPVVNGVALKLPGA